MRRPPPQSPQRGAALILVLGLVSIMSTAAVFSFDSLSRLVQRNSVEQQATQARHYALAAEQISINRMRELITDKRNFGLVMRAGLNRYDYALEAATVTVMAEDISNCFNLGALIKGTNLQGYEANPVGINQFAQLLQTYGIGSDAALAMSSAAADWQDSDAKPLPLGAESNHYTDQELGYRTPNAPMRSTTEMRLIRDFTPALLAQLDELLCVPDGTAKLRLNVTTLQPQHAPLLSAILGGTPAVEDLAQFLIEREPGYFAKTDKFLETGLFDRTELPSGAKTSFEHYPSRIRFTIETRLGDAKLRLVTDVRFNENGTYAIISRSFGV